MPDVLYRQGRGKDSLAELNQIEVSAELERDDLFLFSELAQRLGMVAEALKAGFLAWKDDARDLETAQRYVSLFLSIKDNDKPFLDRDAVTEPSVIEIEFPGGAPLLVSAGSAELAVGDEIITPESSLYQSLMNRRAGDPVDWTEGAAGSVRGVIKSVRHPYVYAFHRALERCVLGVPGGTAPVSRFQVTPDLTEIRSYLESRREEQDKLKAAIPFSELPPGAVSRMVGRDLFEVWASATARGGFGVLCNLGTVEEQSHEQAALSQARGVVLDPIALLSLKAIDALDALTNSFSTVLVPQHVYDSMAESRNRLSRHKDTGILSIGVDQGTLFRSEIPASDIERAIVFLNGILEFCQSRTVGIGRGLSKSERETLEPIFGDASVASLVLADQKRVDGYILLSDQANLSTIARANYGVPCASSFGWLLRRRLAREISIEPYVQAFEKYLRANYRNLRVDAELLTFLTVHERGLGLYNGAAELLISEGVVVESVVGVVAGHFLRLTNEAIIWSRVIPYINAMLFRLNARFGTRMLAACLNTLDSLQQIQTPNLLRTKAMMTGWIEAPQSTIVQPVN